MKRNWLWVISVWTGVLVGCGGWAAEGTGAGGEAKVAAAKPAADLFADDVLVKGKGVKVTRSQLDESFLQFKANMNARNQTISEEARRRYESQLLDRLVVTQLLLGRATDADREAAKKAAADFSARTRETAGSQEAFERQLRAMGFTVEQFETQVRERSICEEVVDREVKAKINIGDAEARKYYDENPSDFERPEMVRAAHILLMTQDPATGKPLPDERKKAKREEIGRLLERARKGEDFAALAREYSEDPGSKEKGGEYTFGRGRMVAEFETAAFSLKPGQISDVVTTQYGYHIIKLLEKLPPEKLAFDKVSKDLKEELVRQEVQKQLPSHFVQLKAEAKLEYLNGAEPPEGANATAPAPAK